MKKEPAKRTTFYQRYAAWRRTTPMASTSFSKTCSRAGPPHQRTQVSTQDPNHRILAHQRSRFTDYYFYIRYAVLGPIIVRVASFFPFHATYWLNGHSFIEQELKRKQIGFHKNDNAFLAVDDVAELQAAADRLSAGVIGKQLEYWTVLLGPTVSKKNGAR